MEGNPQRRNMFPCKRKGCNYVCMSKSARMKHHEAHSEIPGERHINRHAYAEIIGGGDEMEIEQEEAEEIGEEGEQNEMTDDGGNRYQF